MQCKWHQEGSRAARIRPEGKRLVRHGLSVRGPEEGVRVGEAVWLCGAVESPRLRIGFLRVRRLLREELRSMESIHVHIPFSSIRDYLELLRKRRYDLEIYFASSVLGQVERDDIEQLLERLDWRPSLTIHAPFMDLNPGAVDPMVRSATQMRFKQLLSVAAVLKPRTVVFHAAYDRWRYAGRKDVWLENSMDTWPRVMDAVDKIDGMRVAVENVFDEDPEALHLLIERVGHPAFGFCFDTGHFNLFSRVPMEEWFAGLGKHIIEVHLHDNGGGEDSHWALGKGTVEFPRFFRLLQEHGVRPVFTVEAHDPGDIETSLEKVREFLKQ
jgi:sugar phosphate isomerase/epimerase